MAQTGSDALRNFIRTLLDQSSLRVVVMGDVVAGRPNYQIGEMGAAGGDNAEIHTSVVSPNVGDIVLIARQDPMRPAGSRLVFWLRDSVDPTAPAPIVS